MKAEIISVGTELLIGSILNTNARFLSRRLAENAVDVYHQTTVGDNVGRIAEALRRAAARADLVVVSGGLGPTEDDVTMQAVAEAVGQPLVYHKRTESAIRRRMVRRGYRMTKAIARQCYVPAAAQVFQNEKGTAPGVLCRTFGTKWFLILPGPPRELEPLFEKTLPVFLKNAGVRREHFVVRGVKMAGRAESEVAAKIGPILKMKPPLTAGIYARPGEVEVKIMAKAASQAAARRMASGVEKKLRKIMGPDVFGVDGEKLADAVGGILRKKKLTLAVAESCTGGLLSAKITDVPGSSDYFKGGFVAYHNGVKIAELGVDAGLLRKHGAVSQPVARAMARGAKRALKSHWSISLTGIAGPGGGSRTKPVGLVYFGLSGPQLEKSFKFYFYGTRSEIRNRAADKALDLLRRALLRYPLDGFRAIRP